MAKAHYDKDLSTLKEILAKLQSSEVGIEEMGIQVKKAKELVDRCKNRLREIEADLKSIDDSEE